jgi:chemotaxis family two-component system sensor kinase Cph1
MTRQGATAPDLASCDAEPIHLPGSVQPHGLLLVLHPLTLEVLQIGGDSTILPTAPWHGAPLGALLPAAAVAQVVALRDSPAPFGFELALPDGRQIDLQLHRAEAGVMLEIERLAVASAGLRSSPLPMVQGMLGRLADARSVTAFCHAAAQEVRRATGFDRVMVYRFEADGSGAVIAEAREPSLSAYLGLRYPASDIPAQARALYLRNTIRLIPDARYEPAPLVPSISPLSCAPPDLSGCALRSVSPVHLEYLANMGVRASMSLSIVRDGALWGLIACHHATPRHLPAALRGACEIFAQVFSLQLAVHEAAEHHAYAERLHRVQQELVQRMAREEELAPGLIRHRPSLLDFIESEGVALLIEGRYAARGRVPPEADVRALAAWIDTGPAGVAALDDLPARFPRAARHADIAAGVLALSVSREPRDWILWFRPEIEQTVTWAGNPNKPVELAEGGARLSPRRSFEAWRETVRGRARAWKPVEREAALALRTALLEIVLRRLDQVAQERAVAKERQDLLLAELDHRVKNMLANIQAMVRHTSHDAGAVDGYVARLHARLRAMAQAHGLLSRGRWEAAGLQALVEEVTRPYRDAAGPARVLVDGPEIRLRPKAAVSLGLALHELASNAARHGALTSPGGRVEVCWRVGETSLVLDWREMGGPRVVLPDRRGFGCLVLERGLAYELGGRTTLDFAPEGLHARIELPLRQIAEATGAPRAGAASLRGRRVLLVEDSALVALEAEAALRTEGAEVIGPIACLDDALRAAADAAPDLALLDTDLDGVAVFPLADALAAAGVPFLFASGSEPVRALPPRYAAVPVLARPFRGEEAVAALRGLLAEED